MKHGGFGGTRPDSGNGSRAPLRRRDTISCRSQLCLDDIHWDDDLQITHRRRTCICPHDEGEQAGSPRTTVLGVHFSPSDPRHNDIDDGPSSAPRSGDLDAFPPTRPAQARGGLLRQQGG
jgi:hypothetical protein